MSKKILNRNKKGIIIILIILALIIFGIGGYFLYRYIEFKKPLEEKWGQTYYVYLKDIKKNTKKANLPNNLNNAKIGFYEVNGVKDPIMVIEYEKDDKTYSNVYFIENDKVNNIVYNEPTEIEFLYNVEEKKYDYYAHIKDSESDTYISVSDKINQVEKDIYTFKKDEKDSVIDVNGKEISIEKKNEVFVEPSINEMKEDWDAYLKEHVLKDILKKLIKNCTSQKDIEKNVEKEVTKEVTKVEKKQEEIKDAKIEIDRKQAEEEAKRKAEEEAKGLQVGSYRVKYGTYNIYDADEQFSGTITIKSDGTYQVSGRQFDIIDKKSGKFHVGKVDLDQGGGPLIFDAVCLENGGVDNVINCLPIGTNGIFSGEMWYSKYVG